jgi:hypothetical protein
MIDRAIIKLRCQTIFNLFPTRRQAMARFGHSAAAATLPLRQVGAEGNEISQRNPLPAPPHTLILAAVAAIKWGASD